MSKMEEILNKIESEELVFDFSNPEEAEAIKNILETKGKELLQKALEMDSKSCSTDLDNDTDREIIDNSEEIGKQDLEQMAKNLNTSATDRTVNNVGKNGLTLFRNLLKMGIVIDEDLREEIYNSNAENCKDLIKQQFKLLKKIFHSTIKDIEVKDFIAYGLKDKYKPEKGRYSGNALIYAAKKGNVGLLHTLLTQNININDTDANGNTALISAFNSLIETKHMVDSEERKEKMQNILKKAVITLINYYDTKIDAAIRTKNINIIKNRTAPELAAEYGDTSIIEMLSEKGFINDNNVGGVAICAAEAGNQEALEFLLDKHINDIKEDIVKYAAKSGNQKLVTDLLKKEGFETYIKFALEGAAEGGHIEIMEYLVKQYQFKTADLEGILEIASGHGQEEIVKFVLNSNYKISQSATNNAALTAAKKGHTNVVKLICKIAKNVLLPHIIKNMFNVAATNSCMEVLEFLIKADFEFKNEDNTYNKDTCIENALNILRGKTLINEKNDKKVQKSLCDAAKSGCIELVKRLVNKLEGDPKSQDYIKEAIIISASNNRKDTLEYLLTQVTNENKNNCLKHATISAAEEGHTELVKELWNKVPHEKQKKYIEEILIAAGNAGHQGIIRLFFGIEKENQNDAENKTNENQYVVPKKRQKRGSIDLTKSILYTIITDENERRNIIYLVLRSTLIAAEQENATIVCTTYSTITRKKTELYTRQASLVKFLLEIIDVNKVKMTIDTQGETLDLLLKSDMSIKLQNMLYKQINKNIIKVLVKSIQQHYIQAAKDIFTKKTPLVLDYLANNFGENHKTIIEFIFSKHITEFLRLECIQGIIERLISKEQSDKAKDFITQEKIELKHIESLLDNAIKNKNKKLAEVVLSSQLARVVNITGRISKISENNPVKAVLEQYSKQITESTNYNKLPIPEPLPINPENQGQLSFPHCEGTPPTTLYPSRNYNSGEWGAFPASNSEVDQSELAKKIAENTVTNEKFSKLIDQEIISEVKLLPDKATDEAIIKSFDVDIDNNCFEAAKVLTDSGKITQKIIEEKLDSLKTKKGANQQLVKLPNYNLGKVLDTPKQPAPACAANVTANGTPISNFKTIPTQQDPNTVVNTKNPNTVVNTKKPILHILLRAAIYAVAYSLMQLATHFAFRYFINYDPVGLIRYFAAQTSNSTVQKTVEFIGKLVEGMVTYNTTVQGICHLFMHMGVTKFWNKAIEKEVTSTNNKTFITRCAEYAVPRSFVDLTQSIKSDGLHR